MVQRIDGGVKITCPTSEEVVYDGESVQGPVGETGAAGPQGEMGTSGTDGTAGADGTSCIVDTGGVVRCGDTFYQLPVATEEECQVFILPKE